MTDRTAMIPQYPSTDETVGAGGTVETSSALEGAANELLTIDIHTTASGTRVAHGASGIDPTSGYPLLANARNTIEAAAGEVLAFSGAENDVITWTVLR